MNLSMIRSGNQVFANCEYIKGYAFKNAVAGEKSTRFWENAMAAAGSRFAFGGVEV